jgi:hypothetical protein
MKHSILGGIPLVALLFGASATTALADAPPRLDAGPSCEAAARGAVVVGRDKAACMGDENTALDDLKKSWSKFTSDNKTLCVATVRHGGPPSYVELQQCLEIMRDAKAIRSALPADMRIPDLEASTNGAAKPAKKSEAKARRQKN